MLIRVNQRAPEREATRRSSMLGQATFEAVQLPLLTVDVPHIKAALGQWERARGQLLMPSEQSAKPLSVMSARADTALMDVLRNPLDFQIRVFGPGLIAGQGVDFTGRLVSAIEPSRYAALAHGAYEDVLAERAPAFHHMKYSDTRGDRSYFRLLLPLSEDGREVVALWSVTHYYQGPWQPPRR